MRKALPEAMKQSPRWVRWKLWDRKGRITKLPLTVTGDFASTTAPQTWAAFEEVCASTEGNGMGWVLGDGIGCIDLDDCFRKDGSLTPTARAILAEHRADSILVERSVSGRGLHIFLPMAPGPGRVVPGVETYPPDSGRYIAVTGDKYRGG